MRLQIYESIIEGSLNPSFSTKPNGDPIDYQGLVKKLGNVPQDVSAINKLILTAFKDFIKYDCEDGKGVYIPSKEVYYNPTYKYPFDYFIGFTQPSDPKEKFYQKLIELEMQRIKALLKEYCETVQNNFDTQMEVCSTLEEIEHLMKRVSLKQIDSILLDVKHTLFALYIDIYNFYYPLILDKKHFEFEDLYYDYYSEYPADFEAARFTQMFLIAKIQREMSSEILTPQLVDECRESIKEFDNPILEKIINQFSEPQDATPISYIPQADAESVIPTTVTIFFKEVDKYQFRTIPKLKDLPTEKINILITHTLAMDTPYTIAMLNHLEYIKHLQYSYSLTKEQIYKHLSEALNGVSKRRIKGNFLVLNPSSEEDRQTYTACKHVDEVKEYYDSLVNT